ncbi:MAG: hypothetical protein AAGF76_10050 [Pseudomonadota bacterium]
MTAATALAPDRPRDRPRLLGGALLPMLGGGVQRLVAVFLALHPLGAVLVLGWMLRLMRHEAAETRRALIAGEPGCRAPLPGWLTPVSADGARFTGPPGRRLGGLWLNLANGIAATITVFAGTLPFTLLWLVSWWAGWENSFNKGYEQSWVGPVVGMLGVALALPLLARLPMALAHQAVKGRLSAFFARRPVGELIEAAGWRYVWLALLSAIAALPLFVFQALPTFVEEWRPGLADSSPEEIKTFIARYRLLATTYLVLVLIALRRMAARLHARASLALEAQGLSAGPRRGPIRLGVWVRRLLTWACWFAVIAQVFVAQFVNHQWVVWLLPPLSALPWFAPLAPVP